MNAELFSDHARGRTWINTRLALDWELDAITHARKCEHDRDQAMLAGVLTAAPQVAPVARPVTDLALLP